jgi:copper chaperone CopZ
MAALLSIDKLRQHAAPAAVLAHDIAGRLRAIVPQMQHNPREAVELCRRLRDVDGVIDVQANPTAGCVTVHYEPRGTTRARVLEALGHPQAALPRSTARSTAVADRLAEAVAKHLADAAVHALFAALI